MGEKNGTILNGVVILDNREPSEREVIKNASKLIYCDECGKVLVGGYYYPNDNLKLCYECYSNHKGGRFK